ncbi:MAG: hypothetical protein WA366_08585 [Pseudolabrys sp.]
MTGANNTANGVDALYHNNGNNNTAAGFGALQFNTTGSSNLALGFNAGRNLTTGSNNIDIGNVGVAAEANTIRMVNRARRMPRLSPASLGQRRQVAWA